MESLDSVLSPSNIPGLVQPKQERTTPVENNLISGKAEVDALFEFLDEQKATADAAGATFSDQAEKIKQLAAEIKERMIELEEVTKEITGNSMNLEEITKEKNQMEQIVDASNEDAANELLGGGHVVGLSNEASAVSDKVSIKTIYEEKFSTEASEHARGNA